MKLKEFKQGKLDFINMDAYYKISKSKPMFLFEGKYYTSEYVAVEYFKSKGYDAFFSENTTWKNMLLILFDDIFNKFERLGRKKNYKRNFYDAEFFNAYEDEINERFDYLKGVDLKDIISRHSVNKWIKYRILKICDFLERDQILSVLYYMIQDYAHNHVGFPDLFVFRGNEFFFCEVKTNNDVLKPVQVRRHEVLLNLGIDVIIFGVNKKSSWVAEEREKYFNEDYIDEKNFMEVYDYKIKTANVAYGKFKNFGIDDIKREFLERHAVDTFIGFLNVVSRESQIKINERIISKSIKEGRRIGNLRHLSKGMHLEERGFYSEAAEEYQQVETFERYERLDECYRRNKDGEKQVNLIYLVLNEADDVPSNVKVNFKRRADRLFRRKRSITTYDTEEVCPKCGSEVKLTTLKKRNNISIFTCTKDGCYWYGGVFKGDINEFSKSDIY